MSPATTPALTLNNGVDDARRSATASSRRARGDRRRRADRAGESATGTSTPPPRTATSARSARRSDASGVDRDEIFVETKVWMSATTATTETLHAFDKSAGEAGRRRDRPADPSPAAALRLRSHTRGLPGPRVAAGDRRVRAIGVSNFMPTDLSAAARVAPPSSRPSTRSRCTPYFRPVRGARRSMPSTGSCPGVVADRRHHVLPRAGVTTTSQRPAGPDDRRDRAGARRDAGAGHAALAPAAGPLRRSRSPRHTVTDRRELRRVRLRAQRGRARRQSTRLDTGVRGGPEPVAHPRDRPRQTDLRRGLTAPRRPPTRSHPRRNHHVQYRPLGRTGVQVSPLVPRRDDVRPLGQRRPRRLHPHHPPAPSTRASTSSTPPTSTPAASPRRSSARH